MKLYTPTKAFLCIVLFCVVVSCKNDNDVKPERVLVSADFAVTHSASELRSALNGAPLDFDLSLLKYDVDVYRITYKTTYNGNEIVASALVSLPQKAPSGPIISFQHGTIAAYTQAPTALDVFDPESILYSALGAPGMISVAPDLLGFGSSKSVLHPYYVEELTASAVRDAIRAARDLADDKDIKFNGKLFLSGYSQGGYATMATHKSIEAEPLDQIDLVASFPAAGGYDITEMQKYFFNLQDYDQPFYLAFVAEAYKTTFGWTQPLTDVFQEPYADRIPTLVAGSKTSGQINEQLTTHIPDLIDPTLLASINTDAKFKYIVDAFADNSLTDWVPTKPMHMFHGTVDITVPYDNSVKTYQKLVANGASTSVVTFTQLEGADHYTGFFPYLNLSLPMILALKDK